MRPLILAGCLALFPPCAHGQGPYTTYRDYMPISTWGIQFSTHAPPGLLVAAFDGAIAAAIDDVHPDSITAIGLAVARPAGRYANHRAPPEAVFRALQPRWATVGPDSAYYHGSDSSRLFVWIHGYELGADGAAEVQGTSGCEASPCTFRWTGYLHPDPGEPFGWHHDSVTVTARY